MTSKLPILSALEQKDSSSINQILATYRERGIVDHKRTLAIPFEQRIPELIKQPGGRERVSAVLASSILSAFSHIEKAKMSADQIIELAEGVIDSAHEDQLSIEDILLFLKDLLMGKFGKIREQIDMPGFFELLEKYRDKRYKTLESIRYEQHLNYKNSGSSSRSKANLTINRDDDPGTMLDLMQTIYQEKNSTEDGSRGDD